MIYARLLAEMKRRKICIKDVAIAIGRSYEATQKKVAGKRDFTATEMKALHEKLFADVPFAELWE